jgi:hypothetical protein
MCVTPESEAIGRSVVEGRGHRRDEQGATEGHEREADASAQR